MGQQWRALLVACPQPGTVVLPTMRDRQGSNCGVFQHDEGLQDPCLTHCGSANSLASEATAGIEPAMKVLQTSPISYDADFCRSRDAPMYLGVAPGARLLAGHREHLCECPLQS